MNIAILCYHRLGGSGILAHEMGMALAENGHNIHFVGLEPPFRHPERYRPNLFFHKVELANYPVFIFPPYTHSLASQLADIITEYNIDVVHSHYAIPHAVAAILAKSISGRNIKTVTTLHGTDITLIGKQPGFKNITRYAIMESDAVTAVSEYLKEKTVEIFGVDSSKIRRVYNFINPENFNPGKRTSERCGCPPDAFIIGHASNLRPVKSPLEVIEIFRGISESSNRRCVLWIIGDGPMHREMNEKISEYGLKDKVRFMGIQSDIGASLACCDLFLLPSKEESFGLAALEAMACGTPVIASNVGGIPEVIESGRDGFLVECGDVPKAVTHGLRIIEDAALRSKIIENGIEKAVNRFSRGSVIREYEEIYKS
ncbi:MAG: N-acetyl-alpha-D-glucosaminyl L-malate synthase BshA [Fibrobacterota bacterium]